LSFRTNTVNNEEKQRRKQLLRGVREEERQRAEAQLPASKLVLQSLFDWVDEKLGREWRATKLCALPWSLPEQITLMRIVSAIGSTNTGAIAIAKCSEMCQIRIQCLGSNRNQFRSFLLHLLPDNLPTHNLGIILYHVAENQFVAFESVRPNLA